jgi:large subunit ribosomal protein L19e
MNLSNQKRISAKMMKVGKNKVWFDGERLEEIKEAITKADIAGLIKQLAIQKRPAKGTSRVRARKRKEQRKKGRQKGAAHKKGKQTSRLPRKEKWMAMVRTQRGFIKELKAKDLIEVSVYRNLYQKVKGSYFRSKRHIKLYLTEKELFKKK